MSLTKVLEACDAALRTKEALLDAYREENDKLQKRIAELEDKLMEGK